MAVRGGDGSKVWYNGQGKMKFGQGKVSEKSGVSFQTKSGHPVMRICNISLNPS